MIPPRSCGRLPNLNPISRTPVRAMPSPAFWILLWWYFRKRPFLRWSARTFNSCRQLNATGNGQIIIIYMVSYCAWNKHNNLSSRALVWHAYHHDVFVYILYRLWTFWKIAVRKEEKVQVSLSSWLSIKRSEKETEFNSSFSITHQTLQAWERSRAWDAKQSRRLLLSPNRVTHAEVPFSAFSDI